MKADRFQTKDGTYFEGMECETLCTHHAIDGSIVGFRFISPHGEETFVTFRAQLIDVMPEVFESVASESRDHRISNDFPLRFD